jgi:hypothetical protein
MWYIDCEEFCKQGGLALAATPVEKEKIAMMLHYILNSLETSM